MDDDPTLAEEVLGFRIVKVGKSHEYTTGLQIQWRVKRFDAKEGTETWQVDKVHPASEREFKMFELLTAWKK